jgi:predicted ribosomally synthesized peptide with nif11-like leader
MSMKNVTDFFAMVKEDEVLQKRTQLAPDVDTICKIAAEVNYNFTGAELQSFLVKMPKKDLASAVNPGVGNRLHMSPH